MCLCNRYRKFVVVIAALLVTLCIAPVSAQSTDTDAPVFEEILVTSEPGARHRFWVKIVDSVTVERVILAYRLEGETAYHKLPMPVSEQTDWFYAELGDIAPDSVIDYYIQAVDASGNSAQQEHKYNPVLSGNQQSTVAMATDQKPASTDSAKKGVFGSSISTRTVLYGVLGLLAIGAVAAGNSGSSTADTTNTDSCGDEGCRLTITAPTL